MISCVRTLANHVKPTYVLQRIFQRYKAGWVFVSMNFREGSALPINGWPF